MRNKPRLSLTELGATAPRCCELTVSTGQTDGRRTDGQSVTRNAASYGGERE